MTTPTTHDPANVQDIHLRRDDGTLLLTHRIRPGHRPYIHPIIAPDGVGVLTEDSPGHHPWQHGLYTGLNLVNGVGFWKEFDEDGRIHPQQVRLPQQVGRDLQWGVTCAWHAPDGAHLITETQSWTLTDHSTSCTLELEWLLRAEVDIVVGQYMAGGLFLRMPYRETRGGTAFNSEGQIDHDTERQRARWTAVSMPIDGREDWAGVAMMDHPSNPAHPVTWRVDEQLGLSPSRCIAGSWNIPGGNEERYRYRIHIFCGRGLPDEIERNWQEFAAKPQ